MPGPSCPRDRGSAHRGEVAVSHTPGYGWNGREYCRHDTANMDGVCGKCRMPPSRFTLAKAALEGALARRKANERADAELVEAAFDEVHEAEREAAQPPIPPALLEAVREMRDDAKVIFGFGDVIGLLARSHGIDHDRLRDALEAGK